AWADPEVGVVVLTGAGDKAFSAGGDQRERTQGGYTGGAGIGMDVHGLHGVIRAIPKPVIAMVNGYAIGGGHVLHVLCDLTIAADTAVFGQTGPRVGSVDPGFGTAYLARIVGEKKARELWYLCRQYSAAQALAMGLVNQVVPAAELRAETERWCRELLEKSPTAPTARSRRRPGPRRPRPSPRSARRARSRPSCCSPWSRRTASRATGR